MSTAPTTGFPAAMALLRQAVDKGDIPGAVLAAGWGPGLEGLAGYGWAELGANPRPISAGTVFDLASLTKVVATLPVVLHLLASGRLALDAKVVDLLPGFGGGSPERSQVTVGHLLTHTAGLPAERRYWRLGLAPEETRRRFLAEPLVGSPGRRVVYSDIGFMVLGWLAEEVTGDDLGALVARWVTGPLQMGRTSFLPSQSQEFAATERRPDGRPRVGLVHDENAEALRAPSGHAGLFSVAEDLALYLAAWTSPEGAWLPRALREEATADRTSGLDGHRGLGWVARHDHFDRLGERWPGTSVFHSGFTGTSLAMDMSSGRWVVMLTNEVHLGRDRGILNPLREAVHTALAP